MKVSAVSSLSSRSVTPSAEQSLPVLADNAERGKSTQFPPNSGKEPSLWPESTLIRKFL